MNTQTRRLVEKRRRGIFGWFFLVLFWGWNLLMIWFLFKGVDATNCAKYATDAERTGCAAGTGLGIMMIFFLWAAGDIVFGLLAYFTRGKREMIEYLEEGRS